MLSAYMTSHAILSRTCATLSMPLASAISCAAPASNSANGYLYAGGYTMEIREHCRQRAGELPFAVQKNPFLWNEYIFENNQALDHRGATRNRIIDSAFFPRAGARNDADSRSVRRYRKRNGIVPVRLCHRPGRQHAEFIRIGSRGNVSLCPADNHAARSVANFADVKIGVALLRRPQIAVSLHVRHRDV